MSVVIVGATSSIGKALAAEYVKGGKSLLLASRGQDELERIASDLRIRYDAVVSVLPVDVMDSENYGDFMQEVRAETSEIETLIVLSGYLGDNERAKTDFGETERILLVNYVGVASILTRFTPHFQEQGHGEIAVVSSVAGDRGRQSNYPYGSAKAGLDAYAQGLRNHLYHHGVHVLTVKPGFVDTSMTYGMEGLFFVATPEKVAQGISRALNKRLDTVYLPWFWRWIMLLVRYIPEPLFKRLNL